MEVGAAQAKMLLLSWDGEGSEASLPAPPPSTWQGTWPSKPPSVSCSSEQNTPQPEKET